MKNHFEDNHVDHLWENLKKEREPVPQVAIGAINLSEYCLTSKSNEDDEQTNLIAKTAISKPSTQKVVYQKNENAHHDWFWGDLHKLEILTIHDTNIQRDEGAGLLISIRLACFCIMVWLLKEDYKTKGFNYQFLTTWGAYGTLVTFALLILCSIQKYEQTPIGQNITLAKLTSLMFQVCMVTELVINVAFWFCLYFYMTDISHMSVSQIVHKIWYDLVQDSGNYDHSIPMGLLILEYFINNIEFTWAQWTVTVLVQIIYITFECLYCILLKRQVYKTIDWNADFKGSLLKSVVFSFSLTIIFGVICIYGTKLKFWINGVGRNAKDI